MLAWDSCHLSTPKGFLQIHPWEIGPASKPIGCHQYQRVIIYPIHLIHPIQLYKNTRKIPEWGRHGMNDIKDNQNNQRHPLRARKALENKKAYGDL
jgi:hypothetical protein